jgi:hypothetical protein
MDAYPAVLAVDLGETQTTWGIVHAGSDFIGVGGTEAPVSDAHDRLATLLQLRLLNGPRLPLAVSVPYSDDEDAVRDLAALLAEAGVPAPVLTNDLHAVTAENPDHDYTVGPRTSGTLEDVLLIALGHMHARAVT